MPFCLAKNLENPNRKVSASLGSVGREPLQLERGVTSSVFQGSSFTEGNSTWRQLITSFAARRIAFGLSFAILSPGTLKVIQVREGGRRFAPATVARRHRGLGRSLQIHLYGFVQVGRRSWKSWCWK